MRDHREVAGVRGLVAEIAHLPVDGDGALERGPRDVEPALERRHASEQAERAALLAALAGLPVDGASALEHGAPFDQLALHQGERGDVAQDAADGGAVVGGRRERQRLLGIAHGLDTSPEQAVAVRSRLQSTRAKVGPAAGALGCGERGVEERHAEGDGADRRQDRIEGERGSQGELRALRSTRQHAAVRGEQVVRLAHQPGRCLAQAPRVRSAHATPADT